MRLCILILEHMCLDTTADSRAGGSAGKKKLYYMHRLYTCPHTTTYVSSCCLMLQAAVLAMAEDTQTKKTGADMKDQKRRGRGRTYTAVRNLLALLAQKVQILTRRKARPGANQSCLRVRAQIREADGAAGAGAQYLRALLALLVQK